MTDARRVRILVEGRVQGVGFRAFVAREAQARGLAGFVRNLRDGRVEVSARGARDAVAGLCEACRLGPPGSHVPGVAIADVTESAGSGRFVIAPDI